MFDIIPWILTGYIWLWYPLNVSKLPYETPREMFLAGAGLVMVWVYILANEPMPIWIFYALGLTGLWIINGATSQVPRLGLRLAVTYSLIMLFALLLSRAGTDLGLQLIAVGGAVNAIYAFAQNKLKWDFLSVSTNLETHYPIGFVGNSNMLGCFLVPCAFAPMALGGWWTLLAIPTLLGIWITQCRSAFVGLWVGAAFMLLLTLGDPTYIPTLAAATFLGLVLLQRFAPNSYIFYSGTLKERLNYWRAAWTQIKRAPLLGCGFNVFATKVPFVNRHLNFQSKGEFLHPDNYQNPWPQRCHSDFIQHVLDNGLLGASGIYLLAFLAVWNLAQTQPWVAGALVSLLGCGIFFHTFHIAVTNLLFWILVGMGLPNIGYAYPAPLLVAIFTLLTLLTLKLLPRFQLTDWAFSRFFKHRTEDCLVRVHNLSPYSSAVNCHATAFYAQKGDPWRTFRHAMRAIEHTDGEQRMWELWNNLGVACLMNRAIILAELCFRESLSFWPSYTAAQQQLAGLAAMHKQPQAQAQTASASQGGTTKNDSR